MTLPEIRKEIDALDEQMKALFLKRMELAAQVAAVKAETGDPICVPEREQEILSRRCQDVDPRFVSAYRDFLQNLMKLSREYQASLLGRT